MGASNASAAGTGYIATYDPSSKKVTKLAANGFNSYRGLSPFGMDVVPSTHNPDELTIYVTNMRPPFVDLDTTLPPGVREAKRDEIASARAKQEGPDPSIEVFRYILGGDSMQYVATWADEKIMISPNDVVGLPDGKGTWFTNPLPYKVGIVRVVQLFLLAAGAYSLTSVWDSQISSPSFSSKRSLGLGSAGLMGANSLQPGYMGSTGSHDLHLTRTTHFTLPTPSLAE